MDRKQDLDVLIERTMAFAKRINRQPIPDLPVATRTAEQVLGETPKPILPAIADKPIVRQSSERDEIRQRINIFKAHQEKMAREREDYYFQMKAKMMTPALMNSRKAPLV